MPQNTGNVNWISGPVVRAGGMLGFQMLEAVHVGDERLVGEIIGLEGDMATMQVYEDTTGLKPGAPVYGTGLPLSVELGPGLLDNIMDGIQRPLQQILRQGDFIGRGIQVPALDRDKKWAFQSRVKAGEQVHGGYILGTVQESPLVEHRILVPPGVAGELAWVAPDGDYGVEEPIARIKAQEEGERELKMYHRWPVRQARPVARRLEPYTPLITGQRIIDTFFPIAKGGTAGIPGGFGTGKTITQHQLAKYADADIIVYIGCGERGNEMTEVLVDFPNLIDPHSGRPLMERTVLVANTSNMPVAAREASIYTGITMAEYYRDLGYHVALMADSTSRWAEALREISGRLEEMPAEEGFPPYLPSRLAGFYERAGSVRLQDGHEGSVTVVGAVSPPGGDFSEPVTQHTRRFVRCFWELDRDLASARHFPAISWMDSYTGYLQSVGKWWRDQVDDDWLELRNEGMEILHREDRLQQIVQLVGPDILADDQRLILLAARLLREGFLQQNALDEIDTYATPEKQVKLLRAIIVFYREAGKAIESGCPIAPMQNLPLVSSLMRIKSVVSNEDTHELDDMIQDIHQQLDNLRRECRVDGQRMAPAPGSGGG